MRCCTAARRGLADLGGKPSLDCVDDMDLLGLVERASGGNPVPLGEAGAATSPSSMLSDENRMASPRGLQSIVHRLGRSEPFLDETPSMFTDGRKAALQKMFPILLAEPEPPAKRGSLEAGED